MARPVETKVGTVRSGWDILECLSRSEVTTGNANPIYRVRCVSCQGMRTLRYRSFTQACTCRQGVHATKAAKVRDPLVQPGAVPNITGHEAEQYKVILLTFLGGYMAWFRGFSIYSAYAKVPEANKNQIIDAVELLEGGGVSKLDLVDLRKGTVANVTPRWKPAGSFAHLQKSADKPDSDAIFASLLEGIAEHDAREAAMRKGDTPATILPAAPLSRPAGTAIEVITPQAWGDDYAPPV